MADFPAFPELADVPRTVVRYRPGEVIFSLGDRSDSVAFVCAGNVRLSLSRVAGGGTTVGELGPGAVFGEEVLAGRAARVETATAVTPSTVALVARDDLLRLLRECPAFSERFLAQIRARTSRLEQDVTAMVGATLARVSQMVARLRKRRPARRTLRAAAMH